MQLVPDSFITPERLWLLLPLAVLAVGYAMLQGRRQRYAVRFTNIELFDKVAPQQPGWRRHLPASLFLLALVSLVVSFARPAQDTRVPKEQATIVLAIDTSLSMEATDVRPSRFEGAKEAAVEFVESLPEQINLGLISFNGFATVRVNPTQNHDAAIAAIENLELGPGTAIGEAIIAGLDTIALQAAQLGGDAPPARLVVLSDGETTTGRPDDEGITKAQEAGIAVSTIAFGTDRGVIDLPDQGISVDVPVNEEGLAAIADGTGGKFYAATDTDQLSEVYRDIGSQISFEVERDEIAPSYTGIGLLLLAVTGALSLAWFSRLP